MTRLFLGICSVLVLAGLVAVAQASEDITLLPGGGESHPPEDWQGGVPCDQLIRYDDGTDDTPGSGQTLGGPTAGDQWWLGILATPPAGASWEVQSAAFFSEFWVFAGNVNFVARDAADASNVATEALFVNDGGNWEVAFSEPICVPGDFSIVLCPDVNVWGVSGEDLSAPDGRSYQMNENEVNGCELDAVPFNDRDLMIWACVTPCGAIATESATWGSIKSLYK